MIRDAERMPMQRLIQLWRCACLQYKEERRETLFGHAWTSYWVYNSIELSESATRMNWGEWLSQLGIGPEPEFSSLKEEIKAIRERTLAALMNVKFAPANIGPASQIKEVSYGNGGPDYGPSDPRRQWEYDDLARRQATTPA